MARLKPCPFEVRTFSAPSEAPRSLWGGAKSRFAPPQRAKALAGGTGRKKSRAKAEAEYLRCSCALEIDVFFEATA